MNIGPNQPTGGNSGQGGRRRRRRGRGGAPNRGGQPGGQPPSNGGGRNRQAFSGPMDHSYRNPQAAGGNGGGGGGRRMGRGRPQPLPKFFQHAEVEPLPVNENAETKIYCFIDDLFFLAKIQEVARKLNIKVEFVKTADEIQEKMGGNGDSENGFHKPSLIIFDLNNVNAKPLTTIPKLKKLLKKGTAIIGFLSHLQADLKAKAQEAGCDMVLPRSAFSSNLPQLLRRHAAGDDEPEQPQPMVQ